MGKESAMDGIFNIDKATGMTSHDVVARVRRLTRQKRVGHAGTLDPAATGVLPVCLGQATRVVEYLSDLGKAYRATIRFGAVTDTYDAEGQVVRTASVAITLAEIEAALPAFLGEQMQVPPIYSALKRGGRPLYELARAGEAVEVAPRPIHIDALTVVSWQSPDLVLDVECGKGTYIRSLAYDLGERLGPGAHLAALVRTRSGPFTLATSNSLEALAEAAEAGTLAEYLIPADDALQGWPALALTPSAVVRLRQGQPLRASDLDEVRGIAPEGSSDGLLARAYAPDGGGGRFVGIVRWVAAGAYWQPHKVFDVGAAADGAARTREEAR